MRFKVINLRHKLKELKIYILKKFNVEIRTTYFKDYNTISLDSIRRKRNVKSGIAGFQAISKLVNFADKYGLKIELLASKDYGGIPLRKLVKFYKHFGFKTQGESGYFGQEMSRYPKNWKNNDAF